MKGRLQSLAAHCLLFTFTILLVRKLDLIFPCSWWLVFTPLWLFHTVVGQWRFSIPAPPDLHHCRWPPFHALVATPLLVAFELLLCLYLENSSVVTLKIVFFPVLLLEISIIIDNLRILYFALPIEEERDSSKNITWEEITHCLILLSMNFIMAATVYLRLTVTGYTANYWVPSFLFSVGCSFAFLVCTKWIHPWIGEYLQKKPLTSSSTPADPSKENSCSVGKVEKDQKPDRRWSLQNIGGLFMISMIKLFQFLLCMRLQGTPSVAREIPYQVIFSPLLLLQGLGVLFSTLQLLERIVILLLSPIYTVVGNGRYFLFSSRVYDFLEFMLHGSSFLGWWSVDEASREAETRIYYDTDLGCFTIQPNPPDVVNKMLKRDLLEEVWTLQVVLKQQIKTAESRRYERLRKRGLCEICSEREIGIVLPPCGHWILWRLYSQNSSDCPKCPGIHS